MIREATIKALEVPPPLSLENWAIDKVRFGGDGGLPSDIQGAYDPKRFPFFTRILEVMGPEHPSRTVTLRKSAQLGGTILAMIVIGGYLDVEPRETLYVHPTEGNAKRWAKVKWRRFAKAIKGLSALFDVQGSKDASATIMYQERRDGRGFIQISGANSEPSLSMITADLLVLDDLSKWEANDAGDPEKQAESRAKSAKYAKIFKVSTPLLSDNCKISKRFEEGTQEYYHVACPHCGALQPLQWEVFQATIDKDNFDNLGFPCVECSVLMRESDRAVMMDPARGAKWIAENPSARQVSFHLWTPYSPLENWYRIAEEWLSAEGDPEAEQTFFNDWLGLAYQGAGESPPWEDIRDRAEKGDAVYPRRALPAGALFVTLGIDCQGNRLEWHAVAFGRNKQRWVIDYGVIHAHISDAEARTELDKLILREWPNAWGRRIGVVMTAIDANYETDAVLDWSMAKPATKVIAIRGAKGEFAPDLLPVRKFTKPDGTPFKGNNRYFFHVGVSPMKGYFYKALEKVDPSMRGYVGIPRGMGDDYFQMLTAEVRKPIKQKDGSREYRWVKKEGQPNEALDTMLYAEAAACRVGWKAMTDTDFDRLSAQFECQPDEPQGDLEDLLVKPQTGAAAAPNTKSAEGGSAWDRLKQQSRGE